MILEVALGIVLGFIIIQNLEAIMALFSFIFIILVIYILPLSILGFVLFLIYENLPNLFIFLISIPILMIFSFVYKKVSEVIDPYGPKIKKLFTKA